MTLTQDEDEHSLEMHLPYIYTILSKYLFQLLFLIVSDYRQSSSLPGLVPVMVGATNASREKEYGRFLAPYVADHENLFIISSDFCHW